MKQIQILEEQAIDAAINLRWADAIEINNTICEQDDTNLGAYLRLGFAYMQKNDIENARKSYKKALTIQPKNHIALENLERLAILAEKKHGYDTKDTEPLHPDLFLEIPGKTKTIQLVNIGQKDDLVSLVVGQAVELKLKKRKVEVRTKSGTYIGTLPDDLSRRIMYFLQEKSTYKAYIKEATLSSIILFVREIEKGETVEHLISFPQNTNMNMPHPSNATESNETEEEADTDDDDDNLEEEDMPEEVDKDLLRYRETQEEEEDESDE